MILISRVNKPNGLAKWEQIRNCENKNMIEKLE